ncbi:MAG: GntT/GntP/DsdX family permease, partial [Planctomycetota bacterium]
MNPIAILIIGVVLLLAMILVLRLNAFVALITTAMVISLLSPGDFADKIARVGKAFGGAAGNIGIVIAMAAIIGKCMMDSGAADRIVRSVLKLLG